MDEIEKLVEIMLEAQSNGDGIADHKATLLTSFGTLRAERDAARAAAAERNQAARIFSQARDDARAEVAQVTAERDAAQAEVVRLREALKFYANGQHVAEFSVGAALDGWDCPDGSMLVEDGSIASAALESKT